MRTSIADLQEELSVHAQQLRAIPGWKCSAAELDVKFSTMTQGVPQASEAWLWLLRQVSQLDEAGRVNAEKILSGAQQAAGRLFIANRDPRAV